MTDTSTIADEITRIRELLRQKLGVRAPDLASALGKAHRRLPRRVYRTGLVLARAEAIADHPRLRLTLDNAALGKAADEVSAHLEAIDLADRRIGVILSMLGAMSFNLLALTALMIVLLVWRGFL